MNKGKINKGHITFDMSNLEYIKEEIEQIIQDKNYTTVKTGSMANRHLNHILSSNNSSDKERKLACLALRKKQKKDLKNSSIPHLLRGKYALIDIRELINDEEFIIYAKRLWKNKEHKIPESCKEYILPLFKTDIITRGKYKGKILSKIINDPDFLIYYKKNYPTLREFSEYIEQNMNRSIILYGKYKGEIYTFDMKEELTQYVRRLCNKYKKNFQKLNPEIYEFITKEPIMDSFQKNNIAETIRINSEKNIINSNLSNNPLDETEYIRSGSPELSYSYDSNDNSDDDYTDGSDDSKDEEYHDDNI